MRDTRYFKMFALAALLAGIFVSTAHAQQNLALGDNVTASASSSYNSGYTPEGAIDGDRKGSNWGSGGGWNDSSRDVYPDTLTVSFPSGRTYQVAHVTVYSLVDTFPSVHEPSDTETCNSYGLVDFSIDLLDASNNVLASQSVSGNTLCKRDVSFSVTARVSTVRLNVTAANGHFSRVTELEIYPR